LNTDRWYYRVFQSAPVLIRALLPGDSLYRFEALERKELSHRLDGVLWPRESTGCAETGSAEFPVVLLQEVHWINLEELSQQPNLDPLLNLLTLPVRPESELATSSREILAKRPDLAAGRVEGRQEGEAAGHLTGGRLKSHRTTTGLALSAHFCHTDKANI
jgi:predicted transposase YdaD